MAKRKITAEVDGQVRTITADIPDDATSQEVEEAVHGFLSRQTPDPTVAANKALESSGLVVSDPFDRRPIPAPLQESMSTGQLAMEALKRLGKAAVAPINPMTYWEGAKDVGTYLTNPAAYVKRNLDPSTANSATFAGGGLSPDESVGMVAPIAAGATIPPMVRGAKSVGRTISTAASTPGTGHMIMGATELGGGLASALTGHYPVAGLGAAVRGAFDISKGWAKRQEALAPKPKPTAAPPPIQGSNARPLPTKPTAAPPPVTGSVRQFLHPEESAPAAKLPKLPTPPVSTRSAGEFIERPAPAPSNKPDVGPKRGPELPLKPSAKAPEKPVDASDTGSPRFSPEEIDRIASEEAKKRQPAASTSTNVELRPDPQTVAEIHRSTHAIAKDLWGSKDVHTNLSRLIEERYGKNRTTAYKNPAEGKTPLTMQERADLHNHLLKKMPDKPAVKLPETPE